METLVSPTQTPTKCYHCGDDCPDESVQIDDKHFCCVGCQTVYEILDQNDLCSYYDIDQNAGISLKGKNFGDKFSYLEEAEVLKEVLDFQNTNVAKVTLYIPSIHCSSCVWLLENMERMRAGVHTTRLNFVKKELAITYNPTEVNLRQIVELLATLGYEPLINLETTEKSTLKKSTLNRRLLLQIGVTGFCMGNIMLLSFPEYFHFDIQNAVDKQYKTFFVWLNLVLSLPVYFYGASDYLKGAFISIRENIKKHTSELSVDIPIALGITALFVRSLVDTLQGEVGYWDSLSGLVFFLLVGKWIQEITFNYLSFERNYKSYFPLAVKIKEETKERFVPINTIQKDQVVVVHHQELIPADAILLSEKAHIDYSFVTGEAEPITKEKGAYIYAGGRQMGEKIELLVQKPTSQSYLTQLWNNEVFNKNKATQPTLIAANFSKYFTYITLAIAACVALYWAFADTSLVWTATTAVLMVACPCALTLSMPFTMGAVMAIFGKHKFYVKNQAVIQHLNEIDDIVFDKTGTITETTSSKLSYRGQSLNANEVSWIKSLAAQSAHPLSRKIYQYLQTNERAVSEVQEYKGEGLVGKVEGNLIQLGKASFVGVANEATTQASKVYVSINNEYKGFFIIQQQYRKGFKNILQQLNSFSLHLLSGDNNAEREKLSSVFQNNQHYEQKPQDKLQFIAQLQQKNKKVMMIGDGLNDAGALQQSNVGIAIAEDAHTFSPACDAILEAKAFYKLPRLVKFTKKAVWIVKLSFLLSLVYNFMGISWAATGQLSPVVAAIFMPLSSMSVVLFAVITTYLSAGSLDTKRETANHSKK